MTISPSIQGRGEIRQNLANRAIDQMRVNETFIQPILFPDSEQASFTFEAPVYNDDILEVLDDDTVGRDTVYPQDDISIGKYFGSIGMHGRSAHIPMLDRAKAMVEARNYAASGRTVDRLFDLELMHTTLMLNKTRRHNEVLCQLILRDDATYLPSHIFGIADSLIETPIDVVNSPFVREALSDLANLIADDGNGEPANVFVIPDPVWRGLEKNPSFLELLPENAIKRLTSDDLRQILSLPEGTTTIIRPTMRVKAKKGPNSAPFNLLTDFIGVYRVDPGSTVGANFGRNDWLADPETGERYPVRTAIDVYGNEDIVTHTFYRPGVSGKKYGGKLKVTIGELVEEEP